MATQKVKDICAQNAPFTIYTEPGYSVFGHLIEHTDNGLVIYITELIGGTKKPRKVKVYYTSDNEPYLLLDCKRVYFDEFPLDTYMETMEV